MALVLAAVLCAVPPASAASGSASAAPSGSAATVGSASSSASSPVVHTLRPAPGELLSAGDVRVAARISATSEVSTSSLRIDGQPALAVQVERDPAKPGELLVGTVIAAVPGQHTVSVEAEDSAGGRARRSWSFTVTERTLTRVQGPDRFATAAELSRRGYSRAGSASAAVLARADDFADALAGAPLAAAVGGPLLLSTPSGLPAATKRELQRVLAPGATVHLLGGEAALGAQVVRDVAALGLRPRRVAGRDRFATAAEVAKLLPDATGVIVASGEAFPDALAGSVPAAREGLPVLLTAGAALPPATEAALAERGFDSTTVVGGTGAVSEAVLRRIDQLAGTVRRVSGRDRFATAAAVADAFFDSPVEVALASGASFPDALAGAPQAARAGGPLLLTDPTLLPAATGAALRGLRPGSVVVYGGSAAVGPGVAAGALAAAEEGPTAPALLASEPRPGQTASADRVRLSFDRDVDPARSTVYAEAAGREIGARFIEPRVGRTLTAALDLSGAPQDGTTDVRVVVAAGGASGTAHVEHHFTYRPLSPHYATAAGIELRLPSRAVELIGFHQSGHFGAAQQDARSIGTPMLTLPSRGRGTGLRSAADVVAALGEPVISPVTGRVKKAQGYALYCRHPDDYVVIAPDARPSWEVKVLHISGLLVRPGDRVEAGRTLIAQGPRLLPFASQVDVHSRLARPAHVHIEVVDPSKPAGPGIIC